MLDKLRRWNAALSESKVPGRSWGVRALLAWTFFLQIVFMVGHWPPDPPPRLPAPEQSYDLNVLIDPPEAPTPTVCRPVDVLLDNPCGVPVLR